ncbi:MAG: TonB-dependent receptor [Lysobacter sp.]
MTNRKFVVSPLAGALALALCFPAFAAPEPDPDPEPQATDLDAIEVHAPRVDGYAARQTRTATKTDTLLRDVPQAITVVTQELIRDQAMQGIADVVRYIPGVGIAQGEGNRDTPIFRGNASTADLFIDGMRDDVQYFRDLYNIESVEVLKGPNAMIFGRGGSGGVLNRVSKVADWNDHRELSLQLGDYNRSRGTVDVGQALNGNAAFRVTALYEDSESYRDGFELERYGINPTFSLRAGDNTTITLGYEYFRDERIADRGVPSSPFVVNGRRLPLDTDTSTFFGNPALSPVTATVSAFNALVDHDFGNGVTLRNRTRVADHDKFYQNVFPGAVNAAGTQVAISAYNDATGRENLFNQTDLTFAFATGAVAHKLLVGAEFGRQDTDNLRQSGFFPAATAGGPARTSVSVTLPNTISTLPVTFRNNGTSDANRRSEATVAALYVQDQIEFSPQWQAIVGVRFDRFELDLVNRLLPAGHPDRTLSSTDNLVSPRIGLVYKPVEPLSLYASYSNAHLPRSGEQLSSLTPSNRSLDPEDFSNYELGAKWDVTPTLAVTAAAYHLERGNVLVATNTPGVSILLDGLVTQGLEVGLSGNVTAAWSVAGGYAYQDGEIQGTAAGPTLEPAQLPRHSASLWNRYDFGPRWGVGLGAIYRGEMFASTSNAVTLKGFTRYDAALFFTVNRNLRMQLNIENLFDKHYFAAAHNDNNITPGSPRALFLSANFAF